MGLRIISASADRKLAAAVAAALHAGPVAGGVERFPDGEMRPAVGRVRGDDVYVVCSTAPPVSDRLVELLLLLDACRRAGSERVTAVVPYFGYARQDRRSRAGEAVGARLVADVVAAAGAQRLVVVDPHTVALEAMFGIPVEMLTAVPVLAGAIRSLVADDAVLVAPDLGAVKLAERYSALLRLPVAVVRKARVSGVTVHAENLVGDVAGRPAVIVDDMISTGGTVEAAAKVIAAHGAAPDVVVAASHGLFVGPAADRLRALALRRVVVTDTVAPSGEPDLPVEVESVAGLLADAIGRLHRGEPVDELLFGSS